MSTTMTSEQRATALQDARLLMKALEKRLQFAVRGREEVIELLLVALLADGHVLLEDFPGSGKTTLAKALGESILPTPAKGSNMVEAFRRVQFTPDLLPSDITGVSVFEVETSRFSFRPGPIFTQVLLADEINRTSPKVQSAMLEAMAEKQVTVDNVSYRLDELFFVIATQNPRDQVGTFPLPVAQLDRFLFKIKMDFIDQAAELDVIKSYRSRKVTPTDLPPQVSSTHLLKARAIIESEVYIDPRLQEVLVEIARATRNSNQINQGVSTRCLVLLQPALQALAALRGRDFVIPDDVLYLAPHVFAHRIELAPGCSDAVEAVKNCCRAPLEKLGRSSLKT